jgi:hypothetical protein
LLIAVPAAAVEWREDFERLCAGIETAEGMSSEELEGAVKECDKLLKTLEEIDNPKKKMFIFRLKKCRNFYQYSIDLKEGKGMGAGTRIANETAPPE